MPETQGDVNERRMERLFQLGLAKLQSTDSFKSNVVIGLYLIGVTFILGSFMMYDFISEVACFAVGIVFVVCGVCQLSEWRKSRDQKLRDLEKVL